MRALLFLPVAAAVQVLETSQPTHAHFDYDGLKVSLKAIAEKGEIDGGDKSAVEAIMEQINDVLLRALDEDRNCTQTTYNIALEQVRICDNNRANWFATEKPIHDAHTAAMCGDHADHRRLEQTKCQMTNRDCDEHDAEVTRIQNEMPATPNFAGGDSDAVNTFMNDITDLVCANYDLYRAKRADCRNCCAMLGRFTADGHQKQVLCEVAACSGIEAVETYCGEYQQCRFDSETALYQVEANTREEEAVFQAQRVALENLLCYGRVILEDTRDFSECETRVECNTLPDCPTIDYNVNTPPYPFIRCEEAAATKPCEGSWLTAAYGAWNTGEISRDSCVPVVNTCTSCSAPTRDDDNSHAKDTGSGCVRAP